MKACVQCERRRGTELGTDGRLRCSFCAEPPRRPIPLTSAYASFVNLTAPRRDA